MLKKFILSAVFLLCAGALFAQSTPSTSTSPAQTEPARRRGEPCWQQAGIERSVVEQVRSIGSEARSKVESVCSSSSLTPQQKRQQVQEIHQQATLKREALVTVDQRKAFMACQQGRSGSHASGGGAHEGLGGGCGEMTRYGSRSNGASNGTHGAGVSNPPQPIQSSPQN